jgi:hypothetical protein
MFVCKYSKYWGVSKVISALIAVFIIRPPTGEPVGSEMVTKI